MRQVTGLESDDVSQLIFKYLTEISLLTKNNEIFDVLLDMEKVLSSLDICNIWIVDNEKQEIYSKITHNIKKIIIPMGFGIVGSVFKTGEAFFIDDLNNKRIYPEKKSKSFMVVPIFDNNHKVIAAFQAIHYGINKDTGKSNIYNLILASSQAVENILSEVVLRTDGIVKTQEGFLKNQDKTNQIKILGAYGSKAKGLGTSSFYINKKNMIDAGNMLSLLDEDIIEVENIWLTHSHLDHIADIAYVLDNFYQLRGKSLNIWALPETIKILKENFFNNKIWPDFSKVLMCDSSEYCLKYTELELGKEYFISEIESMQAFKTDHTVESCGYIYTLEKNALLISGDTYSLENILNIIELKKDIKSVVLECSFPSSMFKLAQDSKHLTPKLLFDALKKLKRSDFQIYLYHLKPNFISEITKDIHECGGLWESIILKDDDFINF